MNPPFVEPYLFFGGRCAEALEFYQTAVGARVEFMMRYDQSPDGPPEGMLAEGFASKIMHASFFVGESHLMASDGCKEDDRSRGGFTLSLTVADAPAAEAAFTALSEGGAVSMPLGKTFWSESFGMLTDRFGIEWMVTTPVKEMPAP